MDLSRKLFKLQTFSSVALLLSAYLTYYAIYVEAAELVKSSDSGRIENFFSILGHASSQGAHYARDLVTTFPYSRVLLKSVAVLSLFFIFMRLIIVVGPIILLGALTREGSDTRDLPRMVVEFYNQVIQMLDQQLVSHPRALQSI